MMRTSRLAGFALLSGLVCIGCAPRQVVTSQARAIEFAIDASAVTTPLYVTVGNAEGQPGWVMVTSSAGRAYFRPRCEIADCGQPPAVCGAGMPVTQNIGVGGSTRRVSIAWDGVTSVVDAAASCERREPAPAGQYTARFCYSRELSPAGPGPGGPRLANPQCTERQFTLSDTQVVLKL